MKINGGIHARAAMKMPILVTEAVESCTPLFRLHQYPTANVNRGATRTDEARRYHVICSSMTDDNTPMNSVL